MEAGSWYAPLWEWAEVTGCKVVLDHYPAPERRRSPGDWWKQGRTWCLHLDDAVFARFDRAPDEVTRLTLTWLVHQWAAEEGETGYRWLEAELRRRLQTCPDETVAALARPLAAAPQWPFRAEAGRLIWLQPYPVHPASLREDEDDIQAPLMEVVHEVNETVEAGWLTLDDGSAGVWLFWPAIGEGVPTPKGAADGIPSGLDLTEMRCRLTQLLQAFGADLFVAYEAAVGALACSAEDLPYALCTTVLTWQRRHLMHGSNRLYIWQENPLDTLLVIQTNSSIQMFLQAMAMRLHAAASEVETCALPDDLQAALVGLVHANLNVSEAARLLYLHRNTLLHRIDRIRDLTGYDPRNFADAMTLYLAQLFLRHR
ncbi:PucR family transcriptional regulator [Alicyclobacillus herbarius]|uniref:PucR family transcriptional regulator n=1 Tax=Alicyclobacillus herbarius TaxID=122960 RepID=UPI002355DA41|nr:helix-turn-helix domain-containing protein [Alicyclobacillus herbarius]